MSEFQKFKENDLDECVDLFIDNFTKAPWFDKYDSREQVMRFFKEYLNINNFWGYVLKENGKIIALSIGEKKPWIEGKEYYIDQFCVKPTYREKATAANL